MNPKPGPGPECGTAPFARNHYFNGKMLVERDFTEEQRYHACKLQFHQKYLHGHGVACGLKVTPHPTPSCRDRLVMIEPGAAFDCCGRSIAVRDTICFSFADIPAVAALAQDKNEHVLQICIRYAECATDLIPVLYDDCGDGSRCEPNRVIESYEFDIKVDPAAPGVDVSAPEFAWKNTLNAANARAVVLHEGSHRLYIATASDPGTIFPVDAENRDFLTPLTLGGTAEAVTISADGQALVVAVAEATGLALRAYDVADLAKAPVELILPMGATAIELALAPDGRLFGLVQGASGVEILTWGDSLLAGSPIASTKVADASAKSSQPVFSTDGTLLYLIDGGSESVVSFDLRAAAPAASIVTLPAGASAGLIALAHDTAGDTLVVSDASGGEIYFRAPDGLWSSASVPLAPAALVPSRGGAWLYVLATDGTEDFVHAIGIHRAMMGLPQPPDAVVKVGKGSAMPALSASGGTLFVPFSGGMTSSGTSGGVAVIEVAEQDCGELLWRSLDGCPSCDEPDCIVLATIEHYHFGDSLEGLTDPPTEASDDIANHLARIDNRAGRVLLPSTQVLSDVIRCMLEEGHGGGGGKQGPPGSKGADGVSVTSAVATSVPPGSDAKANFDPTTGLLSFEIPRGKKGDPGVGPDPEPKAKLVSICGINWHHASTDQDAPPKLNANGLLVAFNGLVRAGDINRHSFSVLTKRLEETPAGVVECWCELFPTILRGVRLKKSGDGDCPQLAIADGETPTPDAMVNGAQIKLKSDFVPGFEYRVVLEGDLIRSDAGDGKLRSLDGNHLHPWVPARPSGDGVEGGRFVSWFAVSSQ